MFSLDPGTTALHITIPLPFSLLQQMCEAAERQGIALDDYAARCFRFYTRLDQLQFNEGVHHCQLIDGAEQPYVEPELAVMAPWVLQKSGPNYVKA